MPPGQIRPPRSPLAVRVWLSASLAVLVSLAGCTEPRRPNVLLYVVDTLRADALQVYDGGGVETPAIEQLAAEAVVYERAYAPSSWTRPSIVSLLTGLRPDVHGVETRHQGAPRELHLLSEHFRKAGYATGAIVTNPNVGRFFGFDQGYDDFIEAFAGNTGSAAGYGSKSDVVTARAIEWIDGVPEPFFLLLHTTDPHWPYDPPTRFDPTRGDPSLAASSREIEATRPWSEEENRVLRELYRGEIAFNDESFGRLLDHLRVRGLYDETVIVFTSDHGEEFGEHGDKGHGKTLFEEQVHIPLIVRRPDEPAAGARSSVPVQLVDVAPTLLALAGLAPPERVAGHVISPEGNDAPAAIYASLRLDGLQGQMLLDSQWKLIHHSPIRARETGIRGGLFNLADDPHERNDLRDDHPELARSMGEELDRIAAGVKQRAAESRARRKRASREETHEEAELPADLRRSLEALGYLEPEE